MAKEGCNLPTKNHSVDRGYAWVILTSSFFIHLMLYGLMTSSGVFYVQFFRDFHESHGSTAWISSMITASSFFIGPVASVLTNKFGCRVVAVGGCLIASLGLFISCYAPNIYYLYFSYGILVGVGVGIAYIPAINAVALFFEEKRSIALGIACAGVGVGTFVYPPITHELIEYYHWRGAMIILSGITLNVLVFAILIRPVPSSSVSTTTVPVRRFIKNFGFQVLCINNLLFLFGLSILYTHLPALAEDVLGEDDPRASWVLSALGAANTVGRVAFGIMANWKRANCFVLALVSFTVTGIIVIAMPYWRTFGGLLTLSIFSGFSCASLGTLTPQLLIQLVGVASLSSAYGVLLIFEGIGQLLGAPVAGWLYDWSQGYEASFVIGGVSLAVAGLLLVLPIIWHPKSTGSPALPNSSPERVTVSLVEDRVDLIESVFQDDISSPESQKNVSKI